MVTGVFGCVKSDSVDLHRKLIRVLHRKVIHLESQNMAYLVLGILALISFASFVELCLKR
jgi:hypothetical protein